MHDVPGRAFGIWAFVLAFVFPVLGVVFGFIALSQSRRAGTSSGLAVAGIAIGSVLIVVGVILWIVFVSTGA